MQRINGRAEMIEQRHCGSPFPSFSPAESVGQALPVIGIQKRMPASVDVKKDKELEVAPPEKSAIKTFAGACWVNYPRFSSAQIATPGA